MPLLSFDLNGHRGAANRRPGNVMAAFEYALLHGATTLEMEQAAADQGARIHDEVGHIEDPELVQADPLAEPVVRPHEDDLPALSQPPGRAQRGPWPPRSLQARSPREVRSAPLRSSAACTWAD